MIQRIKNLIAWSRVDPTKLKDQQGIPLVERTYEPSQIIYPNRIEEVLRRKPDASIDDLLG